MKSARLILLLATTAMPALAQEQDSESSVAPPREVIQVIGTTPLGGAGIDRNKIPGIVESVTSDAFENTHSVSPLDTLAQRIPGINLNDVQGNDFFQDLRYHGFTASPLQGTAQGIAVYMNGVRLNEAFGDTVNWDLIPEDAIDRADIWTNNPVFGLNALGGAVNLQMKNGFTWHGLEAEIQGGSYGRISGTAQYGVNSGDFSFYVAAHGLTDGGWRYQSASDAESLYADGGYRTDDAEFHLVAMAGRSSLGVIGPTPLDLIALDQKAIFTWPQTTRNEVGSLALNGQIDLGPGWTVRSNIYGRHFSQKHVDGNNGDFEGCSSRSSFGGDLCLQDDGFGRPPGGKTTAFRNQFVIMDQGGGTFPFDDDVVYGTVDRTSTETTSVGGSLQASNESPLFGHGNNFVVGASIDHSDIAFTSGSYLGMIFPDREVGKDHSQITA